MIGRKRKRNDIYDVINVSLQEFKACCQKTLLSLKREYNVRFPSIYKLIVISFWKETCEVANVIIRNAFLFAINSSFPSVPFLQNLQHNLLSNNHRNEDLIVEITNEQ